MVNDYEDLYKKINDKEMPKELKNKIIGLYYKV
jgi:hypothetical protein